MPHLCSRGLPLALVKPILSCGKFRCVLPLNLLNQFDLTKHISTVKMAKAINLNAGPAKLPQEILKKAQEELLNYGGTGISITEMSHRSAEFEAIVKSAENGLREIMGIPNNYRVIFMHGGATGQFAAVPMNLCSKLNCDSCTVDYVVTGSWSSKAAQEADKYCKVNRVLPKTSVYTGIADVNEWKLSPNASYVYYADNETIHGIEYPFVPKTLPDVPVVCDQSSNFLSRPVDVTKFGVIIASTQKNAGIAGLAVVIVRDDLLGKVMDICPSILDWKLVSDNNSLYNTPPCFAIYMCDLYIKWIKDNGSLKGMAERNNIKSKLIYDLIDQSNGFYFSPIQKEYRSRMNIPFRVGGPKGDETLEKNFLAEAKKMGFIGIKGHRSVGGMRASLFDALTIEEATELKNFMIKFQKENQK